MSSKLSIKEASELMGVSEMLLRLMIRENSFNKDVAFCVKNKNRYYYYINKNNFIKYLN